MLRAKCSRCGSDLDELRSARWQTFDRTAWCFGIFGMGLIVLLGIAAACSWLDPTPFPCMQGR